MTQYNFTSEGVRTFFDDILGDVMDSLNETGTYNGDITITIGSRSVAVPMVSETYEALETALCDAVETWEKEYK